MRQEVQELLDRAQTRGDVFDRPASDAVIAGAPVPSLVAGSRVGVYRVLELVGRGGMGEVYRAERADGQYQQQVALKLVRREAVEHVARFEIERRMLAQLDHPGIARLFDGGLTGDGRPYMVMEWVEGRTITQWCRETGAGLRQRLDIFLQVCEAVAYAHRHLLVHRDLKPGNVMVTAEGRSKLLDFGVAKLLSGSTEAETLTQAPMTPAYAAPEQLTQGPITAATDVYALGLLLFELLTGQRPWHRPQMSLPVLIDKQLRETAPAPSASAAKLEAAPIPKKQLRGDLDAITGYALRAEPDRRYRSAAELADDLRRYLDSKPVLARPESLGYSLNRFVRRNRLAAAFAGIAVIALITGLAVSVWQAREAQLAAQTALREAARATATKDFLIRVFRASDPRIAQDKPRGQITAKELLDLNAPTISEEFRDDPDTQIELLGVVAEIYQGLAETDQYQALHTRHIELARARFGELHEIVINGLIDDAGTANDSDDYDSAKKLLADADSRIERAGLDRTILRARWWITLGNAHYGDSSREQRMGALREAVDLLAAIAPDDNLHASALNELANEYAGQFDDVVAAKMYTQAIAISLKAPDEDAAALQFLYANLGDSLAYSGDLDGAETAYAQAVDVVRRTTGETHPNYWIPSARHARLAHSRGDRVRAMKMFEALLPLLPQQPIPQQEYEATHSREIYAACLVAEGRATEAIPVLEAAERIYAGNSKFTLPLNAVRGLLADAYELVGRHEDARRLYKGLLEILVVAAEPNYPPLLRLRERWGHFLLTQSDFAGATEQFRAVLAQTSARDTERMALAEGGMAQVALATSNITAALDASDKAIESFGRVSGYSNTRTGPYLWLIRSQVLLRSGDHNGARQWAERALEASQRYDHPTALSITRAEAAVSAARRP